MKNKRFVACHAVLACLVLGVALTPLASSFGVTDALKGAPEPNACSTGSFNSYPWPHYDNVPWGDCPGVRELTVQYANWEPDFPLRSISPYAWEILDVTYVPVADPLTLTDPIEDLTGVAEGARLISPGYAQFVGSFGLWCDLNGNGLIDDVPTASGGNSAVPMGTYSCIGPLDEFTPYSLYDSRSAGTNPSGQTSVYLTVADEPRKDDPALHPDALRTAGDHVNTFGACPLASPDDCALETPNPHGQLSATPPDTYFDACPGGVGEACGALGADVIVSHDLIAFPVGSLVGGDWTDGITIVAWADLANGISPSGDFMNPIATAREAYRTNPTGNLRDVDYYNSADQIVQQTPVVPDAPVLTQSSGDASVVLTWTKPDDGGFAIQQYTVYRSGTSGGPYASIGTTTPDTTSYTDSGLTNGATYYYVVRAANQVGAGPESNEATGKPVAPPPPPPAKPISGKNINAGSVSCDPETVKLGGSVDVGSTNSGTYILNVPTTWVSGSCSVDVYVDGVKSTVGGSASITVGARYGCWVNSGTTSCTPWAAFDWRRDYSSVDFCVAFRVIVDGVWYNGVWCFEDPPAMDPALRTLASAMDLLASGTVTI